MTTKLIHVEASFLLIHNFITKSCFRARLRKSSQNFYSVLYELTVPSIPSLFIASPSVSSSEEGHVDVHSSTSLAAFITSLSGSLDWYLAFFAAFPLALSWFIHGVSRKLLSKLFVTVVTEESVLLFQARSTFWKHFVNITFESLTL